MEKENHASPSQTVKLKKTEEEISYQEIIISIFVNQIKHKIELNKILETFLLGKKFCWNN